MKNDEFKYIKMKYINNYVNIWRACYSVKEIFSIQHDQYKGYVVNYVVIRNNKRKRHLRNFI